MFLKLDALQELHGNWEKMNLPELNAQLDEYTNELNSLTEPLTEELKEAIKNFIQVVPMNSGFGVSSSVVAIYNKVTNHEPTEDQLVLTSIDYRILQKVIVDSKPTNIQQMIAVDKILKTTQHLAIKVGTIEEKSRLISPIIVKRETELKTGLEFSEEDNANTRPTEQNVPASLHVVKDEAKKPKAKTKAALKAEQAAK